MASIIWELKENFVSPFLPAEIRIKRADDGQITGDAQGDTLYNTINGANNFELGIVKTKTSMGFGYEYFNWDEFWSAAEEQDSVSWKNLGNGMGATTQSLPHTKTIDINNWSNTQNQWIQNTIPLYDVQWEQENYSITAKIDYGYFFSIHNNHFHWVSPYHPNELGSDSRHEFFNSLTLPSYPSFWGQQGDTAAVWDFRDESIYSPNNHNICLDFNINIFENRNPELKQLATGIYCADVSNVDFNGQDFNVYLPVRYNTYYQYLDLTTNITNFDMPSIVPEGLSAQGKITIASNNYQGVVEVFLLDHEKINYVNAVIGDSLDWYGELTESVVAQYGTLGITDESIQIMPYGCAFEISRNEVKEINFEYVSNVDFGGQTDTYSIFIRSANLDTSVFDDVENTESQWTLMSNQQKWDYIETASVHIYDIYEEPIGDYNPSDSTLIEKPSDIVYHLLENELGYDKEVDEISLQNSRFQHDNYTMGFSVNEEIESKKLIQEIMQSSKSFASLSNNVLKFITVNDTYTGDEQKQTIDADDIINYKFKRTALSDVKTQVEIKYDWDYGLEKYNKSTGNIKINESYLNNKYFKTGTHKDYIDGNIQDSNYYGIKIDELSNKIDHLDTFLTFESKYIRNLESAQELAKFILLWNCNQHNIVYLTLPLKYYNLEIGDIIDFNEMILGRKIYNEKYVLDEPSDMPVRCGQYILPLFMVTETTKGLNNIKITAIQLHHMEDGALTFNGTTYTDTTAVDEGTDIIDEIIEPVAIKGDANLNGSVGVADIVVIVNHILGDSILTGQAYENADMNDSGEVRINDIVLIVNEILGLDNE